MNADAIKEEVTKKVRMVTSVITSLGVDAVAMAAIRAIMPKNAKFLTKLGIGVGALVLTAMVDTHAQRFMDELVDQAMEKVTIADCDDGSPENVKVVVG